MAMRTGSEPVQENPIGFQDPLLTQHKRKPGVEKLCNCLTPAANVPSSLIGGSEAGPGPPNMYISARGPPKTIKMNARQPTQYIAGPPNGPTAQGPNV
jgi:hypothetical protein